MPIRYCLIFGAFVVSVLMWVDRACISAAKSSIAADLSFSDRQMAWVMGAFSLGYALFQVPGGQLADRFGARVVMSLVCLAWSLLTAMTGLVREFYTMLLLRFFFGAGEAGGYPTLAKAYYSWLPMGERGIANSISFSGGRLGAAFAMPAVVYLIQVSGSWQRAFLWGGWNPLFYSLVSSVSRHTRVSFCSQ
jgi:MFS transporter, ACS family, glucarate transporter